MPVSEQEIDVALAGLGYSAVAATSRGEVSRRDLRTDMRGALEAFLQYVTVGETQ